VLGIDPGLERIGYGLIEKRGNQFFCLEHGLVQTPRVSLPDRLRIAHEKLESLMRQTQPDVFATERLVFAANTKTALDVSKALGVVLLTGALLGLPWSEYAATQVKQAVVGHGGAEKKQVQFMVTRLLALKEIPKPDDVADALAVALCHAMQPNLCQRAF
jgi:crossover junction endodeoxyribonuclease RuvC